MTSCRWLAWAGVPMMVGTLLFACAQRPGSRGGGEVTDSRSTAVDGQSAPQAIGVTQGVDSSASQIGDEDAPTTNAARNAELEVTGVVEEGAGIAGDAGGERAIEVTPVPEAGGDATAGLTPAPPEPPSAAPGTAELPSAAPGTAEPPADPVPLPGGDVLPVAGPVAGADVKLDGVLLELVRARRTGGEVGVLAYVERHQPGLSVDRLRVQIVCESTDKAASVREQVAGAGGTVTTSFANYIWAEVSLDEIETLAATEAVWTIGVSQALVQPGVR